MQKTLDLGTLTRTQPTGAPNVKNPRRPRSARPPEAVTVWEMDHLVWQPKPGRIVYTCREEASGGKRRAFGFALDGSPVSLDSEEFEKVASESDGNCHAPLDQRVYPLLVAGGDGSVRALPPGEPRDRILALLDLLRTAHPMVGPEGETWGDFHGCVLEPRGARGFLVELTHRPTGRVAHRVHAKANLTLERLLEQVRSEVSQEDEAPEATDDPAFLRAARSQMRQLEKEALAFPTDERLKPDFRFLRFDHGAASFGSSYEYVPEHARRAVEMYVARVDDFATPDGIHGVREGNGLPSEFLQRVEARYDELNLERGLRALARFQAGAHRVVAWASRPDDSAYYSVETVHDTQQDLLRRLREIMEIRAGRPPKPEIDALITRFTETLRIPIGDLLAVQNADEPRLLALLFASKPPPAAKRKRRPNGPARTPTS